MIPIRITLFFTLMSALPLISACSEQQQEDSFTTDIPAEETQKPVEVEYQVIAENLKVPWEIANEGDTFYISERPGTIITVEGDEQTRKPVNFSENLSSQPEAGLLGIALPQDFAETKTAYAYYSYKENDKFYQRVVEIKESGDSWEETKVLLDEIPGGRFHQGGRIAIGPDQKLYVTTGDATNPDSAQNLESLAGKILRMNLDGSIPEDNPFDKSYVYTYGHRNPQGLAWNSANELYATEHGSDSMDEINLITQANNYGWPEIRGDKTEHGMIPPVIHSGEISWAPSGMTYFKGSFYFASLGGEGLRRFNLESKKETLIVDDVGRVRDVHATSEGIYFVTNNTDGRGDPAVNDDRLLFVPASELAAD
ncbi:PQQ-dependent sugar dehydrogenase [Virgibacillus kekensis]|uniref:PQQ-dependent sugar dehydrogenase n=1 Tax=Virgibacillus kekensis TaxID=202261 RepID=A0ABV9DND8_9BACI